MEGSVMQLAFKNTVPGAWRQNASQSGKARGSSQGGLGFGLGFRPRSLIGQLAYKPFSRSVAAKIGRRARLVTALWPQ
jgi:hypothetical protein